MKNIRFWDKLSIESYKLLLSYDQNNAKILQQIGFSYYRIGDIEQSLKYLKRSLKIDGNNSKTYYLLSFIYNNIKKPELAKKNFKKYIQSKIKHDKQFIIQESYNILRRKE